MATHQTHTEERKTVILQNINTQIDVKQERESLQYDSLI